MLWGSSGTSRLGKWRGDISSPVTWSLSSHLDVLECLRIWKYPPPKRMSIGFADIQRGESLEERRMASRKKSWRSTGKELAQSTWRLLDFYRVGLRSLTFEDCSWNVARKSIKLGSPSKSASNRALGNLKDTLETLIAKRVSLDLRIDSAIRSKPRDSSPTVNEISSNVDPLFWSNWSMASSMTSRLLSWICKTLQKRSGLFQQLRPQFADLSSFDFLLRLRSFETVEKSLCWQSIVDASLCERVRIRVGRSRCPR